MSDLFSFGQNWVDQIKRMEKKPQILKEEQWSLAYYFLHKYTIIFTLHEFKSEFLQQRANFLIRSFNHMSCGIPRIT